jgi:hypothetical protein
VPSSLSHVVVLTDDLDAALRYLGDVARIKAVNPYETDPEVVHALFGWPLEHSRLRGAFVGEGPGSIDLLEIPEALRGSVQPGARFLASVTRDVEAAAAQATEAGFGVRGPFEATTATGGPMSMIEVTAGGVPFELVTFG